MKGIIDKDSGTTLNRVLERLLDRGQPGLLNLISQPEGKRATLEMGSDEVRHVNFEDLSGDDAIKAIHALPLWSFEFTAVNRTPVVNRGPRILRPVVKSPARIEIPELVEPRQPAVEVATSQTPSSTISPKVKESLAIEQPAEAVAENIVERGAEKSTQPVALETPKAPAPPDIPADPDYGFPVFKFAFDGTAFTPASHPTEDQEFLKSDCYFLYHQARSIGRCLGLTTLQGLAYAEDRGARAIAYRMQRGSAFRGSMAEEQANALQILGTV